MYKGRGKVVGYTSWRFRIILKLGLDGELTTLMKMVLALLSFE